MTEKDTQGRAIEQTIGELLAHIDFNISTLPESAKHWRLSQESLNTLTENLQRERVTSRVA